jgi:hypothetical protein
MNLVRGEVRPIGGLATAVAVLLGIASLISVGVAIALLNRASLVNDINLDLGPTRGDLTEIEDADRMAASMNAILAIAILSTGIVFIIWQYKYAKNADALTSHPLGLGPGWAIGGWFIPFANLVLPTLQLRRSASASDPQPGKVPGIVTAWMIAYIAASVMIFAGLGTRPSDNEAIISATEAVTKFARADTYQGLGLLVYAAAGILAIFMVRTLTARQHTTITTRAAPTW